MLHDLTMKNKNISWIFLFVAIFMTGCANHNMEAPGAHDTTNFTYYPSQRDFLERLQRLEPGMHYELVFAMLDRKVEDFEKLNRSQILYSLYGRSNQFTGNFRDQEQLRAFLQSLQGFRLSFKSIEKEHGFDSPIRLTKESKGFNYTVDLVFYDGRLYEYPIIAGGPVNETTSETIFDMISPSRMLNSQF